jgi:hypothetical protein
VDVAGIRRQITRAFRRDPYAWGAAGEIAADLSQVAVLGDRFADAGQWTNAATVYLTVAEESLEQFQEISDDEGEFGVVIYECSEGLARCLDAQATLGESDRMLPEIRASLIHTLYEIWRFDHLEMGGIDISGDAVESLARNATEEERQEIEEWLRKAKRSGGSFHDSFGNQAIVGFLMRLKEHSGIGREELLEEYRRFQLWTDAANLLLQMERVDEALAVAQEHLHQSYAVTQFAEKLLALGGEHTAQGLALVEERLRERESKKAPDPFWSPEQQEAGTYQEWLETQYAAQGMPEKSLTMALRRFEARPGKSTYDAIRQAAQLPGLPEDTWKEIRPALIAQLEAKNHWHDLTMLYLDEGAVRQALDALKETERKPAQGHYFGGYGGYDPGLVQQVAKAAEQEFPDEAYALYMRLAEAQIGYRNRDAYKVAASYLVRAGEVRKQQGRGIEWREAVSSIREKYKTLRALREEMNAVGLP